MWWKILFGLYSLAIFSFFTCSYYNSINSETIKILSNKEVFIALGVIFAMYVLFNIFQTLAKKINFTSHIVVSGFLLITGAFFLNFCKDLLMYDKIFNTFVNGGFIAKINTLIALFIVVAILFFPLYYPLLIYLRTYNTFPKINNAFLRNFAFFGMLVSAGKPLIGIYTIFIEHSKSYKDLIPFCAEIIIILAFFNIAFDKRILSKRFWQIAIFPAFLVDNLWTKGSSLSLTKETFQANIDILCQQPISFSILITLLLGLILYTLYKYSFTNYFDNLEIIEPNKAIVKPTNEFDKNKNLKRVDRFWFNVLILFLGSLGIHWFYAKKTLKGLIYLLLFLIGCNLSFFLAIMDLISACRKKTDENGCIWV